jgi:Rhs element Vgr protein
MPVSRTIPTTRDDEVVTTLIKVNNQDVPQTILLDTITVSKEVNRIASAKIVLMDGDGAEEKFTVSNGTLFVPGNEIEILCGYKSDNHTIFKGIIVKQSVKIRQSGGTILIVECRDKSFQLTLGRKSRYFPESSKDSEVISMILQQYSGLQQEVAPTLVIHPHLVQYQSTDWDFIVMRADANAMLCFTDDGKITIKIPAFGQAPAVSLLFGATILELDAEMDARLQLKAVKSKSWNPADQVITEDVSINPGITLPGNISPDTMAGVGGLDIYEQSHGGSIQNEELRKWGDALWMKHQLAKVRGRVRFKGIHTVKPGMVISLNGISDRFNGNVFVSGIQHTIAAGNWILDVQFGLDPEWFAKKADIDDMPASGLLPAIHGLHIGLVTKLEGDPLGEYRILVRLPIISTTEDGIWARVCTPDAGNERGSFFLPEIGDEVIVGFLNDDPRDAVVLGMVNSRGKPAPIAPSDSNHQKGWVTRSKLKLIFDDQKKKIVLETPGKRKVTLDDDAGILKLEDDDGNSILLDSKGITIESSGSITLQAGTELKLQAANLTVAANAALKLESTASAEINGGGSLTLKGGMIQIN